MLTGTTELALRALILLGLRGGNEPVSPRRLASTLGCSPTYLGKTLGHLVKSGILRSSRGARGGVIIARDPAGITLLEIVESCQGAILGDYCEGVASDEIALSCRFHREMAQLHEHIVRDLGSCTLAELLACPAPAFRKGKRVRSSCRMALSDATSVTRSRTKAPKPR